MFPFIRLGPLLVQLPGLALLAGVWIGSVLAEKRAARLKVDPADVYNLIFYGLVAGIAGARLAYAARYPSVYLASPFGLFALTPATLHPDAGLVIGITAAMLFGWRRKLPLRSTLDALAPGLAAFMVALGLAHFLSGDAFGTPVRLPWAIYLWDDFRHPTQIYEILASLAIFAMVWKRPFGGLVEGRNFLLGVALSAAARVFLEAFRGDSVIWAGGFRAAQVVGLLILSVSLWLMRHWAQPAAARPASGEEAQTREAD